MKKILSLMLLTLALNAGAAIWFQEPLTNTVPAGSIFLVAIPDASSASGYDTRAVLESTLPLSSGAAGFATNVFDLYSNYDGVIIMPYWPVSASISNSSKWFGPWLGTNYAQQAVNALAAPNNNHSIGGGKILVIGTNFYSDPLLFTNSGVGAPNAGWQLEAAGPYTGALICKTNPAIRVGINDSACSFRMENMLVSSTANSSLSNLMEVGPCYGKVEILHDWFIPWVAATNNGYAGMMPPTIGLPGVYHNLVGLSIVGRNSDMAQILDNSFEYLASGLYLGSDHVTVQDNVFSYCGHQDANPQTINAVGQIPSSSIFSLGCAITLASGGLNDSWLFWNSYFYESEPAYYCDADLSATVVTIGDGFTEAHGSYPFAVVGPPGFQLPELFVKRFAAPTQLPLLCANVLTNGTALYIDTPSAFSNPMSPFFPTPICSEIIAVAATVSGTFEPMRCCLARSSRQTYKLTPMS
ncbi:MAG: hypothetical protein ACLP7I_12050 [Limisphaerales bacterium]